MNHEIFCQNLQLTEQFLANPKINFESDAGRHYLPTPPAWGGQCPTVLVLWGITPTSCHIWFDSVNPQEQLSTLVASGNEGSCQNVHSNKEEGNISQEARLQYNSGKDEQPGPMGKTEVETEREELF